MANRPSNLRNDVTQFAHDRDLPVAAALSDIRRYQDGVRSQKVPTAQASVLSVGRPAQAMRVIAPLARRLPDPQHQTAPFQCLTDATI